MADRILYEWTRLSGFELHDNRLIGNVNGFWFSCLNTQNGRMIVFAAGSPRAEAPDELRRYLRENRKTLGATTAGVGKNSTLTLTRTARGRAGNAEALHAFVHAVAQVLPQFGFVPNGHCAGCAAPSDRYALWENALLPLCDDCLQQKASQKRAPVTGVSCLTGLMGAVLGGLVGVIPWLLAAHYTDRFILYLAVLAGMGAYGGYRLLRGPKRMLYGVPVLALATLFALFAANVVDYAWMFQEEYGVFSIRAGLELLFVYEDVGNVINNLGLSLLFGIGGIFVGGAMLRGYTGNGKPPLRLPSGGAVSSAAPDPTPAPAAVSAAPETKSRDNTKDPWEA